MIDRYFYIAPEEAARLLKAVQTMRFQKRGIDRRAYLIGQYAVLSANRMKLRNVATRDDDLAYLDELIETLMELSRQGVSVVPILGYLCDEESRDGTGWLIEQRAKGEEMYDDAVLTAFYVWARRRPEAVYLSSDMNAEEYILSRTAFLAHAPQEHYDKFIGDILTICDREILIDFNCKSNFFYDAAEGFQFIDLDAHTDYKYGLSDKRPDGEWIAALCGFAPCHFGEGTGAFAHIALDGAAILQMPFERVQSLTADNRVIFEKCRIAMRNNSIADRKIDRALEMVRIFG